jgi:hypothetical protein
LLLLFGWDLQLSWIWLLLFSLSLSALTPIKNNMQMIYQSRKKIIIENGQSTIFGLFIWFARSNIGAKFFLVKLEIIVKWNWLFFAIFIFYFLKTIDPRATWLFFLLLKSFWRIFFFSFDLLNTLCTAFPILLAREFWFFFRFFFLRVSFRWWPPLFVCVCLNRRARLSLLSRNVNRTI